MELINGDGRRGSKGDWRRRRRAMAMETGGGDGDGRRQATGDEGDDERRAAGGGRRRRRQWRRTSGSKGEVEGRRRRWSVAVLLSVRAMGEEWKGKGEDGRSLSGLLPVRAMGEELRGARRARHQKVSEFRISIRTRGA